MPSEKYEKKSKKQHVAKNEAEAEILDSVAKLDPEKQKELMATLEVSVQRHRGPIPDASTLEAYEKTCPGSADRIIKMAEQQAQHRQNIEMKVIKSKSGDSRTGIWFAFIIAMTGLIAGSLLIAYDKSLEGLLVILGDIVTMVGVFVYGTRSEKAERIEKDKILKQN